MNMKRSVKFLSLVLALALPIAGCGAETDTPKTVGTEAAADSTDSGTDAKAEPLISFTSEDGSVRIEASKQWKQESAASITGDDSYSWMTAGWIMLTGQDNESLMVAQYAKDLFPIQNLDDLKQMLSASFPADAITDVTAVDNPTVSGMEVWETDACKMTDDNGVPGELRILYGATEYAHYLILYAASEIDDEAAALFDRICTSFTETAPEAETAAMLPDTVQWFNNTFAVLTVQNGWDLSLYGGLPHDEYGKGMAEYLLESAWEVTDRESADETLDWLLEEGHRVSLQEEYDIDAAGWDYSRAMMLLSYYSLTELYTEEEALDQSLEIAKTIQNSFDSWDDFMESYLIGYEYAMEADSAERREIYEQLKASSENPFQLDWNTPLEKSW
ncbi:MAG: DUF1266 domain-containing protein [Bacteroidales bacterium]|nr:DUF1266 domain-containing protein [Bacteroidales bacterium]MCM1414852.1 DUF1266 domain-containing protein [bacterium]MCM1422484.1 DUF1266 domain-containing protein [bacterium]